MLLPLTPRIRVRLIENATEYRFSDVREGLDTFNTVRQIQFIQMTTSSQRPQPWIKSSIAYRIGQHAYFCSAL